MEIISQPLVSVIALNHNQGKFLEETLENIRNQTCKNIEIIICDDFSQNISIMYQLHSANHNKSIAHLKNVQYEHFRIILKHAEDPYVKRRSKEVLIKSYLRGYPLFEEMPDLYSKNFGNNFLSKILSLRMPFYFFKAINSLLPTSYSLP